MQRWGIERISKTDVFAGRDPVIGRKAAVVDICGIRKRKAETSRQTGNCLYFFPAVYIYLHEKNYVGLQKINTYFMETVVSGIRSTGNLHLGNYFGAVVNYLKMQYEYNCYFFIADYHSLTTHPTPKNLHDNVKQILSEYLACGIDPEVATI